MYLNFKNSIWIASEHHRRSSELARALGADLYEILVNDNQIPIRFCRYIFYLFKTFFILLQTKPSLVFVQNPSLILTLCVCFFKNFFRFKLVVDRHSNFKFNYAQSNNLKWVLFNFISNYTLREADITITTNSFLSKFVDSIGGKSYILQDKLPTLQYAKEIRLEGQYNIVVVSTFSNDEPIEALIEAASYLEMQWIIYFTGNFKKYISEDKKNQLEKKNIRFTGFVSDSFYQSLLKSSDLVVVLTTEEYLLTCGAYEAVSLEKALIVSNTETMRDYFCKGVIYTDATPKSISDAIIQGIAEKNNLEKKISKFKQEIETEWRKKFINLVEVINKL